MSGWAVRARKTLGALALDVDLSSDGGIVALVGPNGAGKSTVLKLLAGALQPDAGEVIVDGRVVAAPARGIARPPEVRRIGYVPQGYGLFPHLSALDNVAFGLSGPRGPRRERARALLEDLGVGALAGRGVGRLSGGERQRVALARALAVEPALLLLDEPLAALDAGARRQTRTFLAERLAERGLPAVVITHDVRDVVALDADVVVLDAGRVAQRGSPADLARAPATPFVAELFEVPALGLEEAR